MGKIPANSPAARRKPVFALDLDGPHVTPDAFTGRQFTRLKQLSYLLETQQIDPALRWRQGAPVV